MAYRVADKQILITAAAQGMGRAAALSLAREGAVVTATDVRTDLLASLSDESVKAGGRPIATEHLDVTNDAAVEALIARLPPLNVLFNCAGFVHQGSIFETSDQDWDFSFAINVRSMFKTVKAALPRMVAMAAVQSSTWPRFAPRSRVFRIDSFTALPRRP